MNTYRDLPRFSPAGLAQWFRSSQWPECMGRCAVLCATEVCQCCAAAEIRLGIILPTPTRPLLWGQVFGCPSHCLSLLDRRGSTELCGRRVA
ncbi:hypothetical protein BaRGS_00004349 [Batillaria attramentaria]|uniref:Uncharacterized protein n=1 Tax=Batillaria attramentaria TaxID=370345 RepID=A0ABD0LZN9_9CAEN